ncbi:3,4-dihydroxy-2-butanone 4-phosphate synthase [Grifola frondosa]|uniref:3,4-dihydroxy-2-butanone 4-phosphate synthase n=1 Tax=Grifola frondosa TaxID=5627 RepID=A0A1C7LXE9_GRIFR|nr:3,4-dihydroxy-2-butanone 4-phosphate synthase [Grifola frondosa]
MGHRAAAVCVTPKLHFKVSCLQAILGAGECSVDNQAQQVCTFSFLPSSSLWPVCLDVNRPPANGCIRIALLDARLDKLEIPVMVSNDKAPHQTSYTIAIDCRINATAGISTHELTTLDSPSERHRPASCAFQRRPRACGHTDSGIDLCAIASIPQAGVLYDLGEDNESGSMMRATPSADLWIATD